MEILFLAGLVAAVALPLHLLNLRDAEQRELEAAMKSDPRLRNELICARDFQEAAADQPRLKLARAAREGARPRDQRKAA